MCKKRDTSTTTTNTKERDGLKNEKNQEARLGNLLSNDKASHRSLHVPYRVLNRTRAWT